MKDEWKDSYVVLNKLNTFPEDVREDLDLEISKEEIAQAFDWMKLGEKARPDGIWIVVAYLNN